jgi:nitroimidazol reductase NimA-like FMN-containing flavoprotein (pyridoxamine 5'-phosphate oxidase superfamily)
MERAAEPSHDRGPASARTTVRRGAHRAIYDRDAILRIIDEATVCHVGVSTPEGPLVLPMSHGRDDDHLFLHGALASGVLLAAIEQGVCVTFTLLDGYVFARSAYHNSVNYRSVVVRGPAERLEGERKVHGLRRIADHLAATWDVGRPPTDSEVRRTLVVAVPLAEASAKVRAGDPGDEEEDLDGPWWAGTVPVRLVRSSAVPAADLADGIDVPEAIVDLHEAQAEHG